MATALFSPIDALMTHWPEYLIEATLLGVFMVVACGAVVGLYHPESPLHVWTRGPRIGRLIIGVLMGLTAIALIYSPLGQRSGAHMNPGTTLTFYFLGKIKVWDALWYMVAQFAGACGGVAAAKLLWRGRVAHPAVNYAATVPGKHGARAAWIGEFVIGFVMMMVVLASSNHAATAPYTGMFAGVLVALFILVEAPLSGMSLNPARSLGSAVHAGTSRVLWIYFSAPPLGMLAAGGTYAVALGPSAVLCAKLNHRGHERCIFNCHTGESPWGIGESTPRERQPIR